MTHLPQTCILAYQKQKMLSDKAENQIINKNRQKNIYNQKPIVCKQEQFVSTRPLAWHTF
jgi:hypothetical protein